MKEIGRAFFTRKPINLADITQDNDFQSARGYVVEKVAEISPEDYAVFTQELYEYYCFLYEERDAMCTDTDGTCHCILVTTPERGNGILVETEGFAYPRYAASVADCKALDLSGAEVLKHVSLSHNLPAEYYQTGIPSQGKSGQNRSRQSKETQKEKNQPER